MALSFLYVISKLIVMPEHGQYDHKVDKWFCGYWMSSTEWEEIHDYSPSKSVETQLENPDESNQF
jgi:hypothetical protein